MQYILLLLSHVAGGGARSLLVRISYVHFVATVFIALAAHNTSATASRSTHTSKDMLPLNTSTNVNHRVCFSSDDIISVGRACRLTESIYSYLHLCFILMLYEYDVVALFTLPFRPLPRLQYYSARTYEMCICGILQNDFPGHLAIRRARRRVQSPITK